MPMPLGMAERTPERDRHVWSRPGLVLALLLGIGLGCASPPPGAPAYEYFSQPAIHDPWSRKIERWQLRERTDRGEDFLQAPAAVAEPGAAGSEVVELPEELDEKYAAFRAEQKRNMAREVAGWIQEQARAHYVPDGPVDRWATLGETLRENGDDCDGLELLTFNLLRELGFDESEVFRAIVYRRDDGQHHMVTLWFENPRDPWVIDPTGAMTTGMPRMSEVPGWVPLKVFSFDHDYTVERDFAVR
jgi:hypothetical protein